MIRPSFPGSVSSSGSSRVKARSGSNSVPQTFKPFGRYVDVGSQKIKSTRPGIRLHGELSCYRALLRTNILLKSWFCEHSISR